MKISVIVPAFNAEKTIEACVQALLSQSLKPFEIIIGDDGSKDNTLKVLEEFGKKIRVISQENAEPAAARNNGARLAKGEVIVFTDSDCIATRDFVKELSKPFKNPEIIGAQGSYLTKQTAPMALFDQADIETRYEKMKKQKFIDFIGSYAAAYRKKAFFQVGGFDEQYKMASGEDPDLSFKLSELGKKMVFCEKAVVYHSHPENLWKYLRTKFYRGYWRVLLYARHPGKKTKDSYTSKGTLYGTLLQGIGILIFSALLSFFLTGNATLEVDAAFLAFGILLNGCFYYLEKILIIKCFKKSIALGIFSLIILPVRGIFQGFGIAAGFLKKAGFK